VTGVAIVSGGAGDRVRHGNPLAERGWTSPSGPPAVQAAHSVAAGCPFFGRRAITVPSTSRRRRRWCRSLRCRPGGRAGAGSGQLRRHRRPEGPPGRDHRRPHPAHVLLSVSSALSSMLERRSGGSSRAADPEVPSSTCRQRHHASEIPGESFDYEASKGAIDTMTIDRSADRREGGPVGRLSTEWWIDGRSSTMRACRSKEMMCRIVTCGGGPPPSGPCGRRVALSDLRALVRDSDGDGIGDLRGVIDRLDHLSWLGVDGIWLSPVTRPPMPIGAMTWPTTARCSRVRQPRRSRRTGGVGQWPGIQVLIDLVPNHTSDRHPGSSSLGHRRTPVGGSSTCGSTRSRTGRHQQLGGCFGARRGRWTRPPGSITSTTSFPNNPT